MLLARGLANKNHQLRRETSPYVRVRLPHTVEVITVDEDIIWLPWLCFSLRGTSTMDEVHIGSWIY